MVRAADFVYLVMYASVPPVLICLQVLNRFLIERNRITIPKSVNRGRIKENFEILDFKLTEDELRQLDALDKNLRLFLFDL